MASIDDFFNLWNRGYTSLLPITPPDAKPSARSSFVRRPHSLGKAPGLKGFDGLWYGLDLKYEAKQSDLDTWAGMDAGVGIRTGDGLCAIDADTLDKDCAVTIATLIQKHLGTGPVRFGQRPKFLAVFRLSAPTPYQRVDFDDGVIKLPKLARVELLAAGRQFVAHGIHPVTRKPYEWAKPLPARHELTEVSPQQLDAFFNALQDALPKASKPLKATDDTTPPPPQDSLLGNPETVRQAVAALPNNEDLFPTYDDYVRVGAAIKAALQDDAESLPLFLQWAGRWPGFDAEVATADFNRIKPPYKVGAQWLYDHADRYSAGAFSSALVHFQPILDDADLGPEDVFAAAEANERKRQQQEAVIHWTDPQEWTGKEPPPREWIVDGLIPKGEVTLLTGKGGVGKTLLAQQIATHAIVGLPLFGLIPVKPSRVLMFLCEDDDAELNRRQRSINSALCIDMSDLSGQMRVASRKYMDNLLVTFEGKSPKMTRTALFQSLARMVEEFQPDLVVVDTIADVFGGSEIDRQQVRQFVQACLGALAAQAGCAVLALGHPSRAGESSGEGTSGSTAWHASVRSRLYLDHATKDGKGPHRRLSSKKANYGAGDGEWVLLWKQGYLECVSASTRGEAGSGTVGVADTTAKLELAILLGVQQLAEREPPHSTSMSASSTNYAPKVLRSIRHKELGYHEVSDIREAIDRMLADGRLRIGELGRRKTNRTPIKGLVVVSYEPEEITSDKPSSTDDLFD